MSWTNLGDISPRQGTLLVRDGSAELDDRGFQAEVVDTTSESNVGGDDATFMIRQGTVFLPSKNFASALDTVGAKLEGDMIARRDHHGGVEKFPIASDEGKRELLQAAYAYGGIDGVDINVMVRIGLPDHMSGPEKFTGETITFAEGSSLWSVMRNVLDGFDHSPEKEPKDAVVIDTTWGAFADLPREVMTRADAGGMPALLDYPTDRSGNPLLWNAVFEHDGCESEDAAQWTSSCSSDACPEEDCPDCGTEVSAKRVVWAGPKDANFKTWWEGLPDLEVAEMPEPAPGF